MSAAKKGPISDRDAAKWWATTFGDETEVALDKFKQELKNEFTNMDLTKERRFLEDIIFIIIDKNQTGFVTKEDYGLFLRRFGPFKQSLVKCYHSLFENNPLQLASWWHGDISDEEGSKLVKGGGPKSFLVRLSSKKNAVTLVFNSKTAKDKKFKPVKVNLINYGATGYCFKAPQENKWSSLAEAIHYFMHTKRKIDDSFVIESPLVTLVKPKPAGVSEYMDFSEAKGSE